MFEFEPDEYIFTKFANYFKRRKKAQEKGQSNTAYLSDLSPRLTIFARAITGESITIYEAEREGGYKNNSFFLPTKITFFDKVEDNISFYLFRVLYISLQKNLNLNWNDTIEHSLLESQLKSKESSNEVLEILFEQFPNTDSLFENYISYFKSNSTEKKPEDFSFVYGKWMRNNLEEDNPDLNNFSSDTKTANEKAKTVLKSNAVEEIISVQVDIKQQEDAVLQHQFEKVLR